MALPTQRELQEALKTDNPYSWASQPRKDFKMDSREINFIPVSEYSKKYAVDQSTVRLAVKNNELRGKTLVNHKVGKRILHVEDISRDHRVQKIENLCSAEIVKTQSPIALLAEIQVGLGGDVQKASWVPEENLSRTIPHQEAPEIFVDTVVVGVPLKVAISPARDGSVDSRIIETVQEARGRLEALFGKLNDMPYSYRCISKVASNQMPSQEVFIKNVESTNYSEAIETLNPEQSYWGYQFYRLSTCNYSLENMHKILSIIHQEHKDLSRLPLVCTQIDVTTNLPGAVVPHTTAQPIEGLQVKKNKIYVGECCHTYIAALEKDGVLQAPEEEAAKEQAYYALDRTCVDQIIEGLEASGYVSPIQKFFTETFHEETFEGTSHVCVLEVKIYDKARFHLEVGAVDKPLGCNLDKFIHSDQSNIRKLLENNIPYGMGRIETRFRGNACSLSLEDMQRVHRSFIPVLSEAYLRETHVNTSLQTFLETVKATTSLSIKLLDGRTDFYLAHWTNGLTGKVCGLHIENIQQAYMETLLSHNTLKSVGHYHFILKEITTAEVVKARIEGLRIQGISQAHRPTRGTGHRNRGEVQGDTYRTKYYAIEEILFSNPTISGVANLIAVPKSGCKSTSILVGKSFAEAGLPDMPFLVKAQNPDTKRRFDPVDRSVYGKLGTLLHTTAARAAKSIRLSREKELKAAPEKALSIVEQLDVSRARAIPVGSRQGLMLKKADKFYLQTPRKLYEVTSKRGSSYKESCQASVGKAVEVVVTRTITGLQIVVSPLVVG